MFSILKINRYFSKKCYLYMEKDCLIKTSFNLQYRNAASKTSDYTYNNLRAHLESAESYHTQVSKIQSLALVQNQNLHYSHTDAAMETLRHHIQFSAMLSKTNKYSIREIGALLEQWLNRFDSLGSIEANIITEAFNVLSKVNFLDQTWKRNDQDKFKKLVVKLVTKGYKLLDPVFEAGPKFNTPQIAICLNFLSKWKVLNVEIWSDDVELDSELITEVDLFHKFVVRLINEGNLLLDPKNKSTNQFNSRNTANILNALSKWNVRKLPGAKELVVELMKRGNETFGVPNSAQHQIGDQLTSFSVIKSLHAASKLDVDELQGTKEFVIQLLKQGNQFVDRFNPEEVASSLNALSKWNIDSSTDFQQFVVRLVKRGTLIVDKFNSQDISNCLSAVSEWEIIEIEGAQQFISRLVKKGSSMAGTFKPQAISSCLNAVSKWNTNEIQGTKEFVVQLIRCGTVIVDMYNPQAISNSLNALSKLNLDEMPEFKELIVRLIAKGTQSSVGFSPQNIGNSLNALSKWKLDEFEGAVKFISRLIKRGSATIVGFDSKDISNSLNALSKWDLNQFQGGKEFMAKLVQRQISINRA